jgi:hypothetical protein
MRRHTRRYVLTMILVAAGGCRRDVALPPEPCPVPDSDPALQLIVEPASGAPGRLSGLVVARGSDRPVRGQVRLIGTPIRGVWTDAAGAFAFDSVSPGVRTLAVRAVGYHARTDTLLLHDGAGLRLRIPMRPATTDECGFAVVVVRRPWWKWW